ncbi:hypothetical protein AVEN_80571-1 [Araneus ventricosus]|uniref:Uncharacterized protein n=1 Tax=Araneus ventricosus TaxID=182803 RepID=A0A4Y2CNH3_ARAVE|nr:hypothetical protein AVEN_80571-1 [Araneus ventricosus]
MAPKNPKKCRKFKKDYFKKKHEFFHVANFCKISNREEYLHRLAVKKEIPSTKYDKFIFRQALASEDRDGYIFSYFIYYFAHVFTQESFFLPLKLLDVSSESPISSPDASKTNIDRKNGTV